MRPQPHPFAVPPPLPLESTTLSLPYGQRKKLQLSVSGSKAALISARLQGSGKQGTLPSLGILCNNGRRSSVECEQLTKSFADTYYAVFGATVLLGSTITLGLNYVLDVFVPKDDSQQGEGGATGNAELHVMSDEPVALSVIDEVKESDVTGQLL